MEFIFHEDYQSFTVKMYLRLDKGNRVVIIGQKDGILIEQEFEPMIGRDPYIPLLEMNTEFAKGFLKAVGDYNSREGIKNENENLLKGKLQATEKHLEDLRSYFTKVLDKFIQVVPETPGD